MRKQEIHTGENVRAAKWERAARFDNQWNNMSIIQAYGSTYLRIQASFTQAYPNMHTNTGTATSTEYCVDSDNDDDDDGDDDGGGDGIGESG